MAFKIQFDSVNYGVQTIDANPDPWAKEPAAVKSGLDEIRGKRYLIKTRLGNFYFWVSLTDMMITVPDENSLQNAEIRATLETICRLASKGLKVGLTLAEVAEQMIKGEAGRCPILAEMAGRVMEFVGEGP